MLIPRSSECFSQIEVEFCVTHSQNNPDTGWLATGPPDLFCWPVGVSAGRYSSRGSCLRQKFLL